MSVSLQELPSLLGDSARLAAIDADELRSLATSYPYLQIVQLLIAKKDQATSLQMASLYFPDPIQFKALLIEKNGLNAAELLTDQPMKHRETEQYVGKMDKVEAETEALLEKELKPAQEDIPLYDNEPSAIAIVSLQETEPTQGDHKFKTEDDYHKAVSDEAESIPVNQQLPDASSSQTVHEMIVDPLGLEEPISFKPIIAPLKQEQAVAAEPMVFEPFYTVDYFASQGIRVKEDEPSRDKFSMQLKSFTDWIRTMKRLPQAQKAALSDNIVEEKKVEQMARHSINDQQVETETMAEVWEKQGNHQKAIAVYSKLSLLDPSKSAYFAAKIEHLKKLS